MRGLENVSVYNGLKAININSLPEEAWKIVFGRGVGDSASLTPEEAYRKVPWVYRGVTMRAQAIADLPWAVFADEEQIADSEDIQSPSAVPWLIKLPGLLYRTEMALCLSGAAYWLRLRNRLKKPLGYRWLLPSSINPVYDEMRGLVGWTRKVGNEDKPFKVDDIVYWWLPHEEAELGSGTSPVQAALSAAGLIRNVDKFAEGFFLRGAVNLTLLSVEGNPHKDDLDRLEKWWKKLMAGVKRAWETVAIRASVKPVVLANPPKDLAMQELTNSKREDVSTALGIPHSLLFSNASSFATAKQDDMHFYTKTLVPEAAFIQTGLNEQVFYPLGLRFAFQPERLEIFQALEAEKAGSLLPMVQAGVMDRDELRDQMNLPLREEDTPLVAEDIGDGKRWQDGRLVTQERKRWERKALKALKDNRSPNVPFETTLIDGDEQVMVRLALATAGTAEEVMAAFSAPFREWGEGGAVASGNGRIGR